MILAAVVGVIILAVVGATVFKLVKDHQDAETLKNTAVADLGVTSAAAGCSPEQKVDGTGTGQHLDGQQISYDVSPPSHGPHWSNPADIGIHFYDRSDRPEVERLVHNLEHGWTIVWYDDTAAKDSAEMAVLHRLGRVYDTHGQDPRYNLIIAPWESTDGKPMPAGKHIALTHWSVGGHWRQPNPKSVGVSVYCTTFSGPRLDAFLKQYPYDDAPEGFLWHQ